MQIALGDLGNPASFRNAMRGVDTVVHLAAAIRDQPGGSIEELDAVATLRLVRAAERAGVKRFLFFSAIGASLHSPARFFRSKALAEQALPEADLEATVFAPSIVYSPGDPWITLLDRLTRLPVAPVSGSGDALYQPIWADDVADCVMGALSGSNGQRPLRAGGPRGADLRRDREDGTARVRTPPPPAARAAARRARRARGREGVRRPVGVRHLGRGRADGAVDDDARMERPMPSRSA